MIIKRVAPLSVAKIAALLHACVGLFAGVIISLISLLGGFASQRPAGPILGMFLGVGAIVMLPIVEGCLGFIVASIGCVIYNALARVLGGIRVEVDMGT
jgi:uncharacterized membrane protein